MSDRKWQEPNHFTHMGDIKQIDKQNKQSHRQRQQCGGYQRGRWVGEDEEGKGSQTHGYGRRLDIGS